MQCALDTLISPMVSNDEPLVTSDGSIDQDEDHSSSPVVSLRVLSRLAGFKD
jgi:hypothetical protein